ncbi:MAG TPA: Rv2175c family DNA-binding protein [Streptosporangiaceae bacterium]|nr:Rv2175c family DNA-binding protein [Streptosporangiaceae bacterium]
MHSVADTTIDTYTDDLVGEWLSLHEVAGRLGIDPKRAKQLIRDHKLLAVHRAGGLCVPAAFIHEGEVLKGLCGTLTVLADAGYDDVAALRWMFTADETLPGTPVQALSENRGTEVRRRAQALAF